MIADVRVGLRALLLGESAITAIVGSGSAARLYPVKLPQGVKDPSIVYQRVSAIGDHHMQGASGLAQSRLQIDCWATSIDTATSLANLAKGRIDGYRGTVEWDENSPGNAIVFQGIFFESEREGWDQEAGLYRVSRDYIVWHEER